MSGDRVHLALGSDVVTVLSCRSGRHSGEHCYIIRTAETEDDHYLAPEHTVFLVLP
ncbi:hypothetical protein LCGC14_2646240 [marine sediment metagenome]|uniref:Uncharacterized protein n=1 Tax=marine sediment metagenome TaxID=412755 RepID=A0A0F9CN80_9ZZZZ